MPGHREIARSHRECGLRVIGNGNTALHEKSNIRCFEIEIPLRDQQGSREGKEGSININIVGRPSCCVIDCEVFQRTNNGGT